MSVNIASPKLQTAHLTADEEALVRCQAAMEHKEMGDYEGAQEIMRPLWGGMGEGPETAELHVSVAAEVKLCVGILTGWIGGKIQIKDAQHTAKSLITESISHFESVGDQKKVAASRVELAHCYWQDGELNEARTMLREALEKLATEGETRARALLKLTTIEWSAARYPEALEILSANASLFQNIPDQTTRGAYHCQIAIIHRSLATSENRADYLRTAINEYKQADYCFSLSRNPLFRSDVKNQVGVLLFKLARFKEAHEQLNAARRLTVSFGDKARRAQIDQTRAQVFLAEGKLKEAEAVARKAVSVLEKSWQRGLMTDALVTHGIALARLRQIGPAEFVFQRAIEVAHQAGDLNQAGFAALTLIEEVDQLAPATLQAAYQRAREYLSGSQSQEVLIRLNDAAGKVTTSARGELSKDEATEILLTKPCDLQDRILKYEKTLIKQALAHANGRVTHAASLLNMSYQALSYIIESRHKDLLKERSRVHRRRARTARHNEREPQEFTSNPA